MPVASEGQSNCGADKLKEMLRRRCKEETYAIVAKEAGLSRETLYRTIGEGGNPRLRTLVVLCRALGVSLVLRRAKTKA